MQLISDREKSIKSLERGVKRISWSRFKDFRCSSGYLIKYHGFFDAEVKRIDNTYSICGTVIQRFFQSWFNDRLYERVSDKDWLYQQVELLVDIITFPIESQWELGPTWDFFVHNKIGRDRVQKGFYKGLDPVFCYGLNIQFLDEESSYFKKNFKSRENLCAIIVRCILLSVEKIKEMQVPLDRTISEVLLEADIEGSKLVGQMDFLTNKFGIIDNVNYLKDGYILWDGKYSFGKSLDKDQLMYYAMIIKLFLGVIPSYMGFWNWSTGKPLWYNFTEDWFKEILTKVQAMKFQLESVLDMWRSEDELDLGKCYLPFNPSINNCYYCPIGVSQVCDYSRGAGCLPPDRR